MARVFDELYRTVVTGLGQREVLQRIEIAVGRRWFGLERDQHGVNSLQQLGDLLGFREGADHAHVSQTIVVGVEGANVFGGHLTDTRRQPARGQGQRMFRSVKGRAECPPHPVVGTAKGADHLVVHRSALLESECPFALVDRYGIVVHLAANLLVAVIWIEQRVQPVLQHVEIRIDPCGNMEVVDGPSALCESRRAS